jgi:hypothetical protein
MPPCKRLRIFDGLISGDVTPIAHAQADAERKPAAMKSKCCRTICVGRVASSNSPSSLNAAIRIRRLAAADTAAFLSPGINT